MNNKGFTLIELLAVIVLLGVLSTIVITQSTDVFHTTKNQISKINEKNLKEAANTFANTIITCEVDDKFYNELNLSGSEKNCLSLKNKLFNSGIEVSVDSLKNLDLFEDVSNICAGTMVVSASESNYKVTVNIENVTCK